MKKVKASRSGIEASIEEPARAFARTASGFAEDAVRVEEAAASASDRAMRASAKMIQRNAEAVQHALQCGATLAGRMTERSVDQLGRAIGFSGEDAQKAAQRSSFNIEAIVQSGTVLSEITQHLFEEWADIARSRMDRGFNRMNAFLQCRTPQDFAALQSELLRDNMETLLGYARRAGEHSAHLVREAERRFKSVAEVMTPDALGGRRQTAQRKPAHQAARRKSAHKRSARLGAASARHGGRAR